MNRNTSHEKKHSPLQAIRAFCLQCEGTPSNVDDCLYPACPFYAYRFGKLPKDNPQKPLKTIKGYCLEQCQGGSSRDEVISCQGDKAILGPCPVFPFRLGMNPKKSKHLSNVRRMALVEAGKKYRFHTG